MDGHQRHAGIAVVFVGVGGQCGVIDKIPQAVVFLLVVVDGGVDKLLEVFEPCCRLVRVLRPQRQRVARILDRGDNDIGNRLDRCPPTRRPFACSFSIVFRNARNASFARGVRFTRPSARADR